MYVTHRTSPSRLYGVRYSLPQKDTPALTVRAAAITRSITQAAPTIRLKVPRGAACCHAFCFGCVIPHGSSCVLQTHLGQSSSITLHFTSLAPHTHVHCVWVICSGIYFLPFRGRLRGASQIPTNFIHFYRKAHYAPFRFIPSSFTL